MSDKLNLKSQDLGKNAAQSLFLQKEQKRSLLKQTLKHFSEQQSGNQKLNAEADLCSELVQFLKTQNGIWSTYRALPTEPNINSLPQQTSHLQWVYPRVHEDQLQWLSPGAQGFESGRFSVEEPVFADAQIVALDKIDGFLVPGLGFDHQGFRIGKGKGFYDRSLAQAKGKKVGVAFFCQLVEQLPKQSHDLKMDLVVTEKGFFHLKN